MTPPIPAILDRIRNQDPAILITSHTRPDGDSIGSALGLGLALEQAGHRFWIRMQDPVPGKYRFLPGADSIRGGDSALPQEPDLVLVLDCSDLERIGDIARLIPNGCPLINIDHHPTNLQFGGINWVDPDSAATGEMIFHLLDRGGYTLNRESATALFTAITTDTGSFQYSNTKPGTFQVGSRLLEAGADLPFISENLYMRFSRGRVRLLTQILDRLNFEGGGRFAYAWLDAELFRKTGARRDETEGLIDHIRAIDEVVVAGILERQPDGRSVRISLRSKRPEIDVSRIASRFGGGGHRAAAGASISEPPSGFEQELVQYVCQAIDQANLWPRD